MLYSQLFPLHKFIVTDVLPLNKVVHKTAGFILTIDAVQNTTEVIATVCLVTSGNEFFNKCTTTQLRLCNIYEQVFKHHGVYAKSNGFILTKPLKTTSYLLEDNLSFCINLFARLQRTLRLLRGSNLPVNMLVRSYKKLHELHSTFAAVNRFSDKNLVSLVSTKEKRQDIIEEILFLEAFAKSKLEQDFDKTKDILNAMCTTANIFGEKELHEKYVKIYSVKQSSKQQTLLIQSAENADVENRYTNCGNPFWDN